MTPAASMQITLGRTGITTSALALGCARIGSALTPMDRGESVALIQQAFALGVLHFDTASIYGQGDSERHVGQALQRHRAQVCLSSKAGQRLTTAQALMAGFKGPIRWMAARSGDVHRSLAGVRGKGLPRCFEPAYIEQSLCASLERLRTDHLDIFYLHSPDATVLADPALMERIERLRERGLFRAFGVSCDDDAVAWQAAGHDAVQVVQFGYDGGLRARALMRHLAQRGKVAVLRGFMARPLAAEALSQRFSQALQLPALGGLIVGTTRLQHLRDNVAAFERATRMAAAA